MPYSPPSVEEWKSFLAKDLNEEYTKSLADQVKTHRLSQVQLIKTFDSIADEKDKQTALIGVCIYLVEKIDSGYTYFSSKKIDSYFSLQFYIGAGSDLVTKLLTHGLKVSETNKLNDREKSIYLQRFYDVIKKYPRILAEDASDLLKDINNIMKYVNDRSKEDIDIIMKRPLTKQALLEEFKKIPAEYYKSKSRSYSSSYLSYVGLKKQDPEPDRLEQIKFIQILSQYCKPDDYALMYGYLLFCMHTIPSKKSKLYLECKRVANVDYEELVDSNTRHACYARLSDFVSSKIQEGKWFEWKDMKNPNRFFDDMRKKLDVIKMGITTPQSVSYGYLDSITACAANFGLRILSGAAITTLGEKIGIQLGLKPILKLVRPEAAILVELAGLIATFVSDGLIAETSDSVARKINTFAFEIAKQPFVIVYDSLKQLAEFGQSLVSSKAIIEKNLAIEREWLETLLRVDDSVFSSARKAMLRNVIDFESDADSLSCQQAVSWHPEIR